MKDPWTVLGVERSATEEEIKKAYRTLAKKYHPDRYASAPASVQDEAAEKMREINEAYDTLTRNPSSANSYDYGYTGSGYSGSGYSGSYGSGTGTSQDRANLRYIRSMIQNQQLDMADQLLDAMSNRTAEWYYLKGLVYLKRGWYENAVTYLETAVRMDPANPEYQAVLNQLHYRSGRRTRSYDSAPQMLDRRCVDCCLLTFLLGGCGNFWWCCI